MSKKKIFVNILTMIRLIATFILPFAWRMLPPIGVLIFVVSILLTDMLDGMFARGFHVQSLFGSILDAVADKMFGIMVLLIMCSYNKAFIIIVVLEIVIALINIVGGFIGAKVYSSFTGKTKMWILCLAISFATVYIFKDALIKIDLISDLIKFVIDNREYIEYPFIYMTIGAQIMVCVDYIWHINKSATKKHQKIVLDFKSKKVIMNNLFDTEYYIKNKNKPFSSHFVK